MKLPHVVLNLAISQAHKSPLDYKHGAVIFYRKTILGAGFNWPKGPMTYEKKVHSIHAERDCLAGLRHDQIQGASLLSVRVGPEGSMKCSAPCEGCRKLLTRKLIRCVFYFDYYGKMNCIWL